MATIKSYTDIEQSKKLAEILPLDSADVSYSFNFDSGIYEISTTSYKCWVVPKYAQPDKGFGQVIPCWSLSALLGVLPYPFLSELSNEIWKCGCYPSGICYYVTGDSAIDACYEMILKLHKLNLL